MGSDTQCAWNRDYNIFMLHKYLVNEFENVYSLMNATKNQNDVIIFKVQWHSGKNLFLLIVYGTFTTLFCVGPPIMEFRMSSVE